MSLCINPRCLQPDHPDNGSNRFCQSCGSELVLQGRYRVMRLLSDQSGFGKVYEAYERNIPKLLKVLKESHNPNQKAVELFRQEALVLSQLQHPGIPAVDPDGYFQFEPRNSPHILHCIIMEKIDGLNLRQWMQQQGNHPISEKQALNWLQQIAEILHLVHQKNYFHRDIKPENIMVRSNGQLVLVDFGAAREMTYTYLAQLGGTGGITRVSSAGYTPPEQEHGQAVPQSDFYALGFTFIYLLTGKLPTDHGIYDSLHNEYHWRDYAPQLSPHLADFIDQLISPKAADRPHNTEEVLDAIAHIPLSPQARPTSHKKLSVPAAPSHPSTKLQRWETLPKKWMIGGAICGAALLLGVGGYSLWMHQPWHASAGSQKQISVVRTLTGHTGFINTLAISPDGKTLVSGSADKTIKVWDFETGIELRTLSGHDSPVNTLALSSDGQTLVSGSADSVIKTWNLATGEELQTLLGHTSAVNALLMTPDGQMLVSGSADKTIKLWNLATGQEIRTLTGHLSSVNALEISPDGQVLMSGSADKLIKLWDLATGQELQTLQSHTSFVNDLAVTPDGNTLISAGADKTIRLWNLATGEELWVLTGHDGFVNALKVRPNGQTFLSGSSDETIKIWDLVTGKTLQTLTGYGTHVNYFVVSPDWQFIASGSGSSAIKIWRLPN